MNIVVLDRESIGFDTPISSLSAFGNVTCYDSTPKELIDERISDADVILINKVRIGEDAIRNAKRLKLICIFATGYDNVDLQSARKHGVAVCNVPAYSTASVTACTVASVLALITRLREYNEYVTSGDYSQSQKPNLLTPVFHDLSSKTWGIIGCGNIGGAVARVAVSLGANVLTYQRHKHPIYDTVSLKELCEGADIITVHCPLNDQTRGIINSEMLSLMKKDVILVNFARGAVLNEADVASAVKNGEIGAFGCDVYTTEPFGLEHPYYSIKDLPNVLLTPHCAWGSYEARNLCIKTVCENIRSFLDGYFLNRVDI